MSDKHCMNITNSTAKFVLQFCIIDNKLLLSWRMKPLINNLSQKENGGTGNVVQMSILITV